MSEIPVGYCQCGCGCVTSIVKIDYPSKRRVKGKPSRYIQGHNLIARYGPANPSWKTGKSVEGGYITISAPTHERAKTNGRVFEHILVAEKVLGKSLPQGAVLHHVNHDRGDNRNCNLVICESQSYHHLLHKRERAYKACGHADWIKCWYCGTYDAPKNMTCFITGKETSHRGHHRACKTAYYRKHATNKLKSPPPEEE